MVRRTMDRHRAAPGGITTVYLLFILALPALQRWAMGSPFAFPRQLCSQFFRKLRGFVTQPMIFFSKIAEKSIDRDYLFLHGLKLVHAGAE